MNLNEMNIRKGNIKIEKNLKIENVSWNRNVKKEK
jgi:hypothetical protein